LRARNAVKPSQLTNQPLLAAVSCLQHIDNTWFAHQDRRYGRVCQQHFTTQNCQLLFARWQRLWHNLTSYRLHNMCSSLQQGNCTFCQRLYLQHIIIICGLCLALLIFRLLLFQVLVACCGLCVHQSLRVV